VQATPTPGGTYNSTNGIWTLPTLGTNTDDKTARLQIQALVNQNLINDPADVVSTTNRAEVIAPPEQTPLEVQVTTKVVCSFCIDWEIESVTYNWDLVEINPGADDDLVVLFFLWVRVTNNGPVASDATLSVTKFDIRGGGFGTVTLFPDAPVAVTLDPGQTQTIEFKSGKEEGDDFDFTAFWEVVISDVALLDPVLPNTASGYYSNEVDDAGGDCFVATAAFGSHLARHVVMLRNFRDRHLLTNPFGRWFVDFYYRHSPPIADYIRERETPRTIVRWFLTIVVFSIEYPIATGLILLFPVLVIVRQRKQRKNRALQM